MNVVKFPKRESWGELLKRPVFSLQELESRVAPVLEEVRKGGDAALRKFTLEFDKVSLNSFAVSQTEIHSAESKLDADLKAAIRIASENIQKFHEAQRESFRPIETMPGVVCWRKSVGIQKVGLYIPGGSAPLFSTVLMLGIPAMIAGCEEIVLCTPPAKDGSVHPAILYSAGILGIKRIYKVGGAQAIAAMAYGTETIAKVDKIFGPGNQYVTVAKQLINREGTAIDMPAGPSEVAVLADATGNPRFIAADLLSQAEHGPDSQVLFVTDEEKLLEEVQNQVKELLEVIHRKDLALKSLNNSKFVLVKDVLEGVEMVNQYAPEHLILQVQNVEVIAEKIKNAGSVFLGNYTPEAVGDYASGTNHTLPTNGYARMYSGVSLDSFVKKITFQQISKEGLTNIGPTVEKNGCC